MFLKTEPHFIHDDGDDVVAVMQHTVRGIQQETTDKLEKHGSNRTYMVSLFAFLAVLC